MGPPLLLAEPPPPHLAGAGAPDHKWSGGASDEWAPLEGITHLYSTLEARLGSLAGKGETEKAKRQQGYRWEKETSWGATLTPEGTCSGPRKYIG